jgi:hypothetical protein
LPKDAKHLRNFVQGKKAPPDSAGSPGVCKGHARRSEEKTVIEENTRHSGLDPESRIVKLRREAPQKLIDELDSGSSPE